MKQNLTYQHVIPTDRETTVEVTIKVSDLKYVYNLLIETPVEMVGYHSVAEDLLQVLKDNQFEQESNPLPF